MPTIIDIRKYMNSWKNHTYRQGLDYCFAVKNNSEIYNGTIEVFKRQGLSDKMMDGYSIQNIPIKNEGKVDIIFTDLFWKMASEYISPAGYVGMIVKKCYENNIRDCFQVCGIVGRGLRAFPSFLREMDLTYKMASHFPNAIIENGPNQDVNDHTDILIRDGEQIYRLWSYQNFERGLVNTAARLRGKRGDIPKGVHILCPIDISNKNEIEEVDGWFFYSTKYVDYLYSMQLYEKPDDYSMILRMSEYSAKMYLKNPGIIKK